MAHQKGKTAFTIQNKCIQGDNFECGEGLNNRSKKYISQNKLYKHSNNIQEHILYFHIQHISSLESILGCFSEMIYRLEHFCLKRFQIIPVFNTNINKKFLCALRKKKYVYFMKGNEVPPPPFRDITPGPDFRCRLWNNYGITFPFVFLQYCSYFSGRNPHTANQKLLFHLKHDSVNCC